MSSPEKAVDYYIQILKNSAEISERRNAVIELSKLMDSEAVPHLVDALADHEDVAIFATFALVKTGISCIPVILEKGLNSKNEQQLALSIEILGELGHEDSLETITRILRQERSERVRTAAAEAIGSFRNERSTEFLKSLLNDADIHVVSLAVLALHKKGIREGLCELLLDKLDRLETPDKGIVLWTLVEICDQQHQKKLAHIANTTDDPELKSMLNEVIHGIHLR